MEKLTITEAAKVAGKSRRTLQRHLNEGRLSYSSDHEGKKYIDPSELMRVYGDIHAPDVTPHVAPPGGTVTDLDAPNVTSSLRQDNAKLQQELKELKERAAIQEAKHEREREAMREEARKREDRLLDMLDRQTRLLTHEKETQPPVAPQEPQTHPSIDQLIEQVNTLSKQNKWLNYQMHMDRRSLLEKLIGKKYVKPEKVYSD